MEKTENQAFAEFKHLENTSYTVELKPLRVNLKTGGLKWNHVT